MARQDTFHLSVVTPEKAVLEAEVRSVVFPAHDGEIGILRHRAPLLTEVGIGRLKAEGPAGRWLLFVDGGFAQMVDNRLTVLTEEAMDPGEIDRQAAEAALEETRKLTLFDERRYREHQRAGQRARALLRLAR